MLAAILSPVILLVAFLCCVGSGTAEHNGAVAVSYTHLSNSGEQDFTGRVLILSPDTLRESYWQPENQLWLALSLSLIHILLHRTRRTAEKLRFHHRPRRYLVGSPEPA